jgi:hypothetical protein
MGAHILDKSGQRQLFPARAAAHLVPPLEHGGLESRPLQVAGNDCRVMAASNDHRIISLIWHNSSLSLYLHIF